MRFGLVGGVACAALAGVGAAGYHGGLLDHPLCSSWSVVRFGRASSAVSDVCHGMSSYLHNCVLVGILGGCGLQVVHATSQGGR